MKKELFVVIAYDIVSDKRRKHVVKTLKDFGGRRMNYSVFECQIKTKEYIKLRQSLLDLIQEKRDSVLLYEICATCKQKVYYMGINQPWGKGEIVIL